MFHHGSHLGDKNHAVTDLTKKEKQQESFLQIPLGACGTCPVGLSVLEQFPIKIGKLPGIYPQLCTRVGGMGCSLAPVQSYCPGLSIAIVLHTATVQPLSSYSHQHGPVRPHGPGVPGKGWFQPGAGSVH